MRRARDQADNGHGIIGRTGTVLGAIPRTPHTHRGDRRTDYFIALHEVAHVVLDGEAGEAASTLECEAEAWEWALEHSRVKPTQAVKAAIRLALGTYHAARRGDEPPSGHVYWRLLESGTTDGREVK